jgi:hypothetical protein
MQDPMAELLRVPEETLREKAVWPYLTEPDAEEELREANGELHVLTREHARQNKELKTAKLVLEQTVHELNTVYWHLRKIREVLPTESPD